MSGLEMVTSKRSNKGNPTSCEPASKPWGNETPHKTDLGEVAQPVFFFCATSPTSFSRSTQFLSAENTPKEFNCFEEASRNPAFPAASLRARRMWGKRERTHNATSKKLNRSLKILPNPLAVRSSESRGRACSYSAESRTNLCEANLREKNTRRAVTNFSINLKPTTALFVTLFSNLYEKICILNNFFLSLPKKTQPPNRATAEDSAGCARLTPFLGLFVRVSAICKWRDFNICANLQW